MNKAPSVAEFLVAVLADITIQLDNARYAIQHPDECSLPTKRIYRLKEANIKAALTGVNYGNGGEPLTTVRVLAAQMIPYMEALPPAPGRGRRRNVGADAENDDGVEGDSDPDGDNDSDGTDGDDDSDETNGDNNSDGDNGTDGADQRSQEDVGSEHDPEEQITGSSQVGSSDESDSF